VNVLALEAGIVTADAAELIRFYGEAFDLELSVTHAVDAGTLHKLRAGRAWLKIFEPVELTRGPGAPERG